MTPFTFALPTRVVFGDGMADTIGAEVYRMGRRAFLVTDPGIVEAGHAERVETSLAAAGVECRRFDRVCENPTASNVAACRDAVSDFDPEVLIGLGGGSSIDVAKGCAFLLAGGGTMEDYWGVGKAKGTLLPLVAVPTTAGTGSEVQSFALISQDDTHRKMACGDPSAAPRLAVLDPTLTLSQPARVTACTGLDALGHALETWVSTARTPAGCLFSAEAFQLINAALPRVLSHPGDLEARSVMLLAAAFAGIAIENGMLGAAHAMANPLTAHHDIPHGLAVALVLPAVIRWNGEDPATADRYGQLARAAALVPPEAKTDVAVEALALRVLELISLAGYGGSLAANGVLGSSRSRLAADAATQWTGGFNPRPVGEAEFQRLLDAAGCPHA